MKKLIIFTSILLSMFNCFAQRNALKMVLIEVPDTVNLKTGSTWKTTEDTTKKVFNNSAYKVSLEKVVSLKPGSGITITNKTKLEMFSFCVNYEGQYDSPYRYYIYSPAIYIVDSFGNKHYMLTSVDEELNELSTQILAQYELALRGCQISARESN